MKNYKFNLNWWENVCNNFLDGPGFMKKFVDTPTKALQIGCFEGMGTVWMLDKILTHSDSTLLDIDPFYSDGDLAGANFDTVQTLYYHNLRECPNAHKHKIIIGKSQEVLRSLELYSYDLIYVDGSHYQKDVLEDAILCHRLLKKGGRIFFDDYGWGQEPNFDPKSRPQEAIEVFYLIYGSDYKVVDVHYQAVYDKIK